MKELIYTSAPRGLRPGTSGFCTVAMSDGLSATAVELLERLSNTYRHLFMPNDRRADENPVAVSLVRARVNGKPLFILSRNAASGTEHSGRTNNLAHHLVFSETPTDVLNPAALAAESRTFVRRWNNQPGRLPERALSGGANSPGGSIWNSITGDANWAKALARAWVNRSDQPFFLIYPLGIDVLGLIVEAIWHVPEANRWSATFTTYFTGLPPDVSCRVRGVVAGSSQEAEARGGEFLDLAELVGTAPVESKTDRRANSIRHVPSSLQRTTESNSVGAEVDDEPPPKNLPILVRPGGTKFVSRQSNSRSRASWWLALLFGAIAVLALGGGVPFCVLQLQLAEGMKRERDEALNAVENGLHRERALVEREKLVAERADNAKDELKSQIAESSKRTCLAPLDAGWGNPHNACS